MARKVVAALSTAGLLAAGGAFIAAPAQAAPTAASTIVVHADQPFRPVTHVATGSLYGLANATSPSDALVQAIKPHTFVMMPIGGHQQGSGDIGKTWQKADAAGAKVVDRLSDYYAGWPYQFSWSNWDQVVTDQIHQVQASGMTNLAAYALWNESDNTWLASNGTFEDFWTHTYRLVRSLDPTTPIQGPSFSDNINDMQNFLNNAVATDTVPDVLAWHELIRSSKIVDDIAKVEAMEDALGIERRPIDIEEYAAPAEVGIPGSLVGYIAKFERLGIRNAELPFWNQSGALGDLLTGQGGTPNGAYWLYKWYADMSGDMVTTTPPANNNFDAAASVSSDKKEVDVITGGTSGTAAIRVAGLDQLQLGSKVSVKLEYTPTYGRTVAVSGPITVSTTNYDVSSDGSITVPIVMNPAYGYHVVVTPADNATDLSGTYTISNVNSGLTVDTQASGTTAGTVIVQNAAPAGGSASQTWKVIAAGSGLYKILNPATGLVLGVQNASSATGTPAVIWSDSGTDDHLWQLLPDGKGNYRLANYGTGVVLGVNGMSKTAGAGVVEWTDGSVTSGCTATGPRQPGKIGSALSFCNSSAYATLPTGAVSSLTGDYTVSAWVNPASNASWQRVFDIGSSSNASMFLTVNDGTELRYVITTSGAGGEQRLNSSTKTLPLNQWSLVTVTVAGSTGTLYVNGQVVATNSNMTVHPSAFGQSTRNYIGKSQYSGDPALNATVDDFNIYSRALTASEVATLASGQAGAGDVVHYAFDEADGTTLTDSSGKGRNGTVVAAASSTTTTTTATDAQTADHFWTLHALSTAGAPSGVSAVVSGSAIAVSWTAPAQSGGTPITGYRVYRDGVADPVATVGADATSASISGVWAGDTAAFTVTALNAVGEGAKSAASDPVTVPDGATSKPAQGVLSNDNGWDTGLQDGDYNVTMNLWWGEEASIYRLYENGTLIASKPLTFAGVGAQSVSIPVHGRTNGTYVYTAELVNSKGSTATSSTTVKVTQANPGVPVLSSNNWSGAGTYAVTANLWWGTNATAYTFYENGVAVGTGSLEAHTPSAQSATLNVEGKAKGSYVYRVEFGNSAGTTSSGTLTVNVTK